MGKLSPILFCLFCAVFSCILHKAMFSIICSISSKIHGFTSLLNYEGIQYFCLHGSVSQFPCKECDSSCIPCHCHCSMLRWLCYTPTRRLMVSLSVWSIQNQLIVVFKCSIELCVAEHTHWTLYSALETEPMIHNVRFNMIFFRSKMPKNHFWIILNQSSQNHRPPKPIHWNKMFVLVKYVFVNPLCGGVNMSLLNLFVAG